MTDADTRKQREANKALVREFFKVYCVDHDFSQPIDKYLTPSFTSHRAMGVKTGAEAWIKNFNFVIKTYMPDFRADIKSLIAEDDNVWSFAHIKNSGETSDKTKTRLSVDLFRFEDGKIAEHWDVQQDVDLSVYGA